MPQPFAQPALPKRPSPFTTQEAEPVPEENTSGPGWGTAALGGAAALGAGLIARKPQAAWEGAKALGRGFNTLRSQFMLSGMAVPKSVMGNIGATAVESAERGTMAPLKELFSMKTARDIRDVYKAGGSSAASGLDTFTNLPGPTPGRIMGSLDQATRNAMGRAGISAEDAERAVFQAPLPPGIAKALDNPVMRYLVPFRRTPFNQLIEGGKAFAPETARQGTMLAGSMGAGGVHGAATADERYPMSVGLGAAGAAKYGLPYTAGAFIGRQLAGASTPGGIMSTALPISEYGLESSMMSPLQPFKEPAALKAFRRLSGGEQ